MRIKIELTERQARDLIALLDFWNADGDVLARYYENMMGGLPLALCGGVELRGQQRIIQDAIDAAKREPFNIGVWIDQGT